MMATGIKSKYEINNNGCWVWKLASSDGYGYVRSNGKLTRAHRHYYEEHNSKIPPGMVIDHLCRNKLCVNPKHLEVVTHMVNCQRGNQAKLTPLLVEKIRGMAGEKSTYAIAEEFSIDQSSVSRILNNKIWKNV